MITHKAYSSSTALEKENFFNYLKSIPSSGPAYKNMWDDDWVTQTHTLPYLLENTNRFDGNNGEYHILYDNDSVVACGGVYKSNFSTHIAFAGTRTWVDEKHRHRVLIRDYLLPLHKEWCLENDVKIVALCFNEYNKLMPNIFKRNRLGEKSGRITTREPKHMFFSGMHELDYPVTIQHTKQWVIYEKLDPAFDFDWTQLKY